MAIPNPEKPEPKLTAKTKKETKKIESGTQELKKVKTRSAKHNNLLKCNLADRCQQGRM